MDFDYNAPAELYPAEVRGFRRSFISFKRFVSAAEAIQYAIEELSASSLAGTILEVDEVRFDGNALRELYVSKDYPLNRGRAGRRAVATLSVSGNDN